MPKCFWKWTRYSQATFQIERRLRYFIGIPFLNTDVRKKVLPFSWKRQMEFSLWVHISFEMLKEGAVSSSFEEPWYPHGTDYYFSFFRGRIPHPESPRQGSNLHPVKYTGAIAYLWINYCSLLQWLGCLSARISFLWCRMIYLDDMQNHIILHAPICSIRWWTRMFPPQSH